MEARKVNVVVNVEGECNMVESAVTEVEGKNEVAVAAGISDSKIFLSCCVKPSQVHHNDLTTYNTELASYVPPT